MVRLSGDRRFIGRFSNAHLSDPSQVKIARLERSVLTARENVRMSLELHDDFLNQDIDAKAIAILSTVGLADRVDYYPEKLSGGQKQRVALA